MVNVLRLRTFLCLFSNRTFVFRTGIQKTFKLRIANRQDPDLNASYFGQATSV